MHLEQLKCTQEGGKDFQLVQDCIIDSVFLEVERRKFFQSIESSYGQP